MTEYFTNLMLFYDDVLLYYNLPVRCAFSDKAVYWFVWRLIYPHAARQAAAVAAWRNFNLAAGWYRNFLPPRRGAALRAAS
jgi:hypothetical protein